MKSISSLLSLLALSISLVACGQSPSANAGAAKNISADEAQAKLSAESEMLILDVRTPREFAGGHLKNAQNIDFYAPNFKERIAELPKDKPYLIYCASGGRSAKGMRQMQEMGFEQLYNMNGGVGAWQRKGHPIVR